MITSTPLEMLMIMVALCQMFLHVFIVIRSVTSLVLTAFGIAWVVACRDVVHGRCRAAWSDMEQDSKALPLKLQWAVRQCQPRHSINVLHSHQLITCIRFALGFNKMSSWN
jgi:hypothetical protein